jgi:hypothetical protein
VIGVELVEAVDASVGVYVDDRRVEDLRGVVEGVDDAVPVAVREVGEEREDLPLEVPEGDVGEQVDRRIELVDGEAAAVGARASDAPSRRESRTPLGVETGVEPLERVAGSGPDDPLRTEATTSTSPSLFRSPAAIAVWPLEKSSDSRTSAKGRLPIVS